jgi:phage gpG-like protein
MIAVKLDGFDELTNGLEEVSAYLTDMTPLMQTIGEILASNTKRRIIEGVQPDGIPFAPKSATTIERHLTKREGMDSRPLIHTGTMSEEIAWEAGPDWVEVGASRKYAAVMQFGAPKGSLGTCAGIDKNGKAYSGAAPWGDFQHVRFSAYLRKTSS